MTKDEAINTLAHFKVYISGGGVIDKKANEALDMAIEALNCSEIPNNSDTISRQQAVDALARTAREKFNLSDEYNYYLVGLMDGELAIKELPSAQPEIIRCKDCRYYQDNNDGYPHINCKWDANETPDADDFCSGAERRTDG